MYQLFVKFVCFSIIICNGYSVNADYKLNWKLITKQYDVDISIIYRDAAHIMIKTNSGFGLLKLKNKLYLLHNAGKIGYVIDATKYDDGFKYPSIFDKLPKKEFNFLPVMLVNGATKNILGFNGSVLYLKDFGKSVTVISSFDQNHIKVKNAITPLIAKLLKTIPNLPNKALLDILKHKSFGLPIQINNQFSLTQSEHVKPSNIMFSLKGYHIVNDT